MSPEDVQLWQQLGEQHGTVLIAGATAICMRKKIIHFNIVLYLFLFRRFISGEGAA